MRYWPFVVATLAFGCSSVDFDSYNQVKSVRVIATRASHPSPLAGETIDLEALTFDGRPNPALPLQTYWFSGVCADPADDAFYQCYPALRAQAPQLQTGAHTRVTIPPDIITNHAGVRGNVPYGLTIVFMMACAGHVEAIPAPAGEGPDAPPFGCFDDQHQQLGPDDFVFTYVSLFSFAAQQNENPVIDHLVMNGSPVDPTAGITVDHCTASKLDDCPANSLDIVVPDSTQEVNPENLASNGAVLREQVRVDYLLTGGKMKEDVVILFDPSNGRLGTTSDDLYAPQSAGDFWLWAVVRDDRGGTTWQVVPLHAR